MYIGDFHAWVETQIILLTNKEFERLDTEHVLEEMRSLGKVEKRTIKSHLIIALTHMLKNKYQQQSCLDSIFNTRIQIRGVLEDSPTLKKFPQDILNECYEDARREASRQTGIDLWAFEKECPWTIEEVLGELSK